MKNLGWHLFFALLVADVLAVIMLHFGVNMRTLMIVCGIVFVVLAVVLFFGDQGRQRIKKREQKAVARIAELQSQTVNAQAEPSGAKTTGNESAVENT